MAEKFIDDKIVCVENDIEKVQLKPTMYISYVGPQGALHCSKEIINNMIDECINKNSPGNEIDIYLDEMTNTLTVSDNGRGIPFTELELSCTKLHSGSKATRESSGGSAGENGVGQTAVNALSSFFEIVSYRYGQKAKVRFEMGKRVGAFQVKDISNKDKHGTTVIFQPSTFFLGEDCMIPYDGLVEWLDKIIYLVPSDIKINFNVNKNGKETPITKKYKNKNGLYDYTEKICKNPLINPIHFQKHLILKEVIPVTEKDENGNSLYLNKEVDRFIGLEVAFSFNTRGSEILADSFCNFINTIDGGVHVDAVKQGILQYFSRQTKDILSEKESKNIDILYSDVSTGLVLTVFLSTDMRPQFASQTKEKLSNNEFFKPLIDMTKGALIEYFKKNPRDLKRITDFIKTIAKARIEANKARNSVIKGETSFLDLHGIKGYAPPNNKGKHEYRELFIIEGNSAMGSARLGRFDIDTQGLLALKGVPLNSFGKKIDDVLKNEEFFNLVRILKCNIGEKFDINNLWFKKIIIMTDADIDGHRITSLVCAFFLCHLPQLIEQGYLYKAVTPLYQIVDKERPYILDKQEFIDVFECRIGDNVKIIDPETNIVFNKDKVKAFLLHNREYLSDLNKVANHFAINPVIIEFLAIHGNDKDFMDKFKKRFPELNIDKENVLYGIYDGRYQTLIMDKIYEKRIANIRRYILNNKAYFVIHEKSGSNYNDRGLMSIGEFLMLCEKFQPEIVTRYKGLGELDPDELRETTLNPENRILIQLTMSDAMAEYKKFRVLHDDKCGEERRTMMENFKIKMEDLDN